MTTLRDREDAGQIAIDREAFFVRAAIGRLQQEVAQPEVLDRLDRPYERMEVPLDPDGFAVSFSPHQTTEIREFFALYGFVAIRGAITNEEARLSEDEAWAFVERHCSKVARHDPSTWDAFPSLAGVGMLGTKPVLSPQFFRNRVNANVHAAFAAVLGTDDLYSNISRAGIMRPTAIEVDGRYEDRSQWATAPGKRWLHWDGNPLTGAATTFSWHCKDPRMNRGFDRRTVQGVLALVDCRPEDGAFYCVPGSHRSVKTWASKNSDAVDAFDPRLLRSGIQFILPEGDPMKQDAQHVPLRAGSLVIWDNKLVHANDRKPRSSPEDGTRCRVIQYMTMCRFDDPAIAPLLTSTAYLPPDLELSPQELRRLGMQRPAEGDASK